MRDVMKIFCCSPLPFVLRDIIGLFKEFIVSEKGKV